MTFWRTHRGRRCSQHGFTIAELVVVVGIIGLVFAMVVPFFGSFYQTSQLTGGAQQVRAWLEQARQQAIQNNGATCVALPSATQMQFFPNTTCTGGAWLGAGTDALGNINLPQGVTVTTTANPVFNYLGAAQTAAVYTVTNGTTGGTLTVTVWSTGRMTIP